MELVYVCVSPWMERVTIVGGAGRSSLGLVSRRNGLPGGMGRLVKWVTG